MPDQKAVEREGGRGVLIVRMVAFFLLIAFLVLYLLGMALIDLYTFPLPAWLRWAGFTLMNKFDRHVCDFTKQNPDAVVVQFSPIGEIYRHILLPAGSSKMTKANRAWLLATDWSLLQNSLARFQAARPGWVYTGHSRRPIPGRTLQKISPPNTK